MNLRRLGHAISHRAPTQTLPRHRTRHDENAPIRIPVERRQSFLQQRVIPLDIRVETLIPFLVRQGVEVFEVGEFGKTRIADDDVQTPEGFDGFSDAVLAVCYHAAVAFDDGRLHAVLRLQFLGEFQRGTFIVGVVDGDVAAFGGELAGDFGTETSGLSVQLWLFMLCTCSCVYFDARE